MRLRQFRVRAFRCIHDSGNVKVGDAVALIGKNESGKTAILEALAHLNRDVPIDRQDICDDLIDRLQPDDRIVEGRFSLSESEKALVSTELPDATIYDVVIFRCNGTSTLGYEFPNAVFPRKHATIERGIDPFKESLRSLAATLATPITETFANEADADKARTDTAALKKQFEDLVNKLLTTERFEFRKTEPVFKQLSLLTRQRFRSVRNVIVALDLAKKSFRQLFVMTEYPLRAKLFVEEKLQPRLLYFAEYKVIDGIIDVAQYLQAKRRPPKSY